MTLDPLRHSPKRRDTRSVLEGGHAAEDTARALISIAPWLSAKIC